ncbi:MAG: flagellar basal body rod protein FlgC [Pseudomonadota bacterium]
MDLMGAIKVAASGMQAQSARLRVTSENLANASSTADVPGGEPYRRKTISFANELDRQLGVDLVKVDRYGKEPGSFEVRYEPNHPAADADGNVLYPNVNPLIELMDMREAQRTFEANLNTMQAARTMVRQLLDLLQ